MKNIRDLKIAEVSQKAAELLMSKYYEFREDIADKPEYISTRTRDVARFIEQTFQDEV